MPARSNSIQLGSAAVALTLGAALCAAQSTRPAPRYGEPREVCTLADRRIHEASGIVASRRNPGLFYVHNDSGDEPLVYLVDRAGSTRVTIRLTGARHVDWEDIALAPRGKTGEFDVCVADIGDNAAQRDELTIYRFAEVDATPGGPATRRVSARAYRIRYADGPADAEAFAVHPRTGDGYIFTKRLDGRSAVYRLAAPWNAGERVVLPKVATTAIQHRMAPGRMITAADISPDGRRLAVRCYLGGWEWRMAPGSAPGDFERLFATAPVALDLAAEPQGEALCYSAGGRAILTVSERLPAVLYESRLSPPPAETQPP